MRFLVHLLAVAAEHHNPGPVLGLGDGPPLGHQGDRFLGVAVVLDQDAEQFPILRPRPHIHGDARGKGVERALLEQDTRIVVAHVPPQFVERPGRQRHKIEIEPVPRRNHDEGEEESGFGQGVLTHAGGPHDHQLAVGDQLGVDEHDDHKQRNGQDDRQEIGQQQYGQVDEIPHRQAAVDDHLHEPQRLQQPDNTGQARGDEDHPHQKLSQHVSGERVHRLRSGGPSFSSGCGKNAR